MKLKKIICLSIYLLISSFGRIYAQTVLNYNWAFNITGKKGNYINQVKDLCIDRKKNILITGSFFGTADFDPGPDSSNTVSPPNNWKEIMLAKYDSLGNYKWAITFGGVSNYDEGRSLTADSSGNVYVTGLFNDSADFDPGPGVAMLRSQASYSSKNAFIAKYDSSGNYVWAFVLGSVSYSEGYGIVADAAGNIFVTGNFSSSSVDFDPGPAKQILSASAYAMFVAKYTSAGTYRWAKKYEINSYQLNFGIALGDSNNVYVTGYVNPISTGKHIYIGKFDSAGVYKWGKTYSSGVGMKLALDKYENIYLTGFNNSGSYDNAYVAKFDCDGNSKWFDIIKSTKESYSWGIAVNNPGEVFLTGYYSGNCDFDPDTGKVILNSTSNNMYLAKYDVKGKLIHVYQYHANDYNWRCGIATDSKNNIYVTGGFTANVDFDFDTTKTAILVCAYGGSNNDVFIAKYHDCTPDSPLAISGNTLLCSGNPYTYSIEPVNSSLSYYWTLPLGWTGYSVDTVIQVIPNNNSSGKISVSAKNVCGLSDIASIDVSADICTGMETDNISDNRLNLYPNPAHDKILVESKIPYSQIFIYNVLGKKVYYSSSGMLTHIDISSYSNGIYVMKIIYSDKEEKAYFVKN